MEDGNLLVLEYSKNAVKGIFRPSSVRGTNVYIRDITIVSFCGSRETLKPPPLSRRMADPITIGEKIIKQENYLITY